MNKSFDLEKIVRPNIKKLKPYHSARQDFEKGLLLDANENSLGAPFSEPGDLHRYPNPADPQLRAAIAEWRGLRRVNVFVGVGSDEGIDLLYRIFCTPGEDRVLVTPPTYGMYKVSADIHDIAVDEVLLKQEGFQPDVKNILKAVKPNTKLLFLCSPNNPTGNIFKRDAVAELVEQFAGIVVVDEAYIDFSEHESWAKEVIRYPNLVVLQTMSKSFGLAGIRLGITCASANIINYMMKVKAPYNVNKLTAGFAKRAFGKLDDIRFKIDAIKKEREELRSKLNNLSAVRQIYPSEANFLLVRMNGARSVYEKLAREDIIVRYRGNEPLCEDCLRITVGTPDENDQLIAAMKNMTE